VENKLYTQLGGRRFGFAFHDDEEGELQPRNGHADNDFTTLFGIFLACSKDTRGNQQ